MALNIATNLVPGKLLAILAVQCVALKPTAFVTA